MASVAKLLIKGGRGYLAIFGCYLDASGVTDDQPHIVMAGFVADVDKWVAFERDWEALLDSSRYRPHLWERNGVRYAHARKMQQWPDERREAFYAETNYLLSRTVEFAVASWVKYADYKAVHVLKPPLKRKDSIYGLSFRGTMVATCANMTDDYDSAPVAFILEEGDPNQGGARTIFDATLREGQAVAEIRKQYPVETITIAPKEKWGALQAADMHAYCMLRHLKSAHARRKSSDWFGDINILLSNLQHSTINIDREQLLDLRVRNFELYAKRLAYGKAKYGQKANPQKQ